MPFNLFDSPGAGIDCQRFTWHDMVQKPVSKLDDDAFTRVRIMLMTGLETEALRFGHMAARFNGELRLPLARVRRIEQYQAATINSLLAPDHSPLETTVARKQAVIETTAAVAGREPDPCLAQVYRFGLLEDLDHLYRYAALLDRLEGKDANNILQSYTDIMPGRPTSEQHRAPQDDLRAPYDRKQAALLTKLHALAIVAVKTQAHEHCMHAAPLFSDPLARQLYAEVAAVEEQHLTQYASLLDPSESWLEQWLLHEAAECYVYYSCVEQEGNHHVKAIWERFLDYELGHFRLACDLFARYERRDPAEIINATLDAPIAFRSHRTFCRQVLAAEAGLRADGLRFVPSGQESAASLACRAALAADGAPSETVAAGYCWAPGTELARMGAAPARQVPA